MSTPILATKLFVPPPRPKAVARPRLIERLNEGLHRKLTLISAPAGFGKTTLVSEWLGAAPELQQQPVAWLSLDARDSDPTRFLAYLVAALQKIAPNLGEGELDSLYSSQPLPTEVILTRLLNEMTIVPHKSVLVLDDYHMIDAREIDQALVYLLEHLPPAMHLVITTREDPRLPLARYRARGQLMELRARDLRFTASEAAEFLNQIMGLTLSAQEIARLENQTEGWIAGLQLAALSMQGHGDVAGFIRSFAGDHRYIVDYLVEEVLQRQPEQIRTFLLQTSILDRLSGALCDAVTGENESNTLLDALERGNFFVVPLDDKRQWYRYHHLFADVLYTHLMAEQPHAKRGALLHPVAVLHQRASEWYAHNGLLADAIRHSLAAADYARAADLVELAGAAMRKSRQEATLLGWLQALPDEVLRNRPVLSVHYAGTLMSNGKLEGVETRLRDAEQWLETSEVSNESSRAESLRGLASSESPIVLDKEEFRRLPGMIAIYRAGYSLAQGNMADTVTNARRALAVIAEDDDVWRGAAAAILGLASWTSGDLEAAHRSYMEGMAHFQRAGYIADAIGGTIVLVDLQITQGRLRDAMRTCERALQLAIEQGTPALRGTADMYMGMSEIHCERNELQAATQYLLRSKEQGEHTGFPRYPYRWAVAMARIRVAEGDLDGALELLHEAEHLYVSDFHPNVRPVTALKTRVWLAQGRLAEALSWVHEQRLSAQDDLSYLREFEHITLARVLLAQHQGNHADHFLLEARGLLARLLAAAEAGGRTERVIEILVLQALAHQLQNNTPAALVSLQRALTLAEPEGYVRIFLDEGPAMAILMQEAARHGIALNYVRQLLTAFGKAEDRPSANQALLDTDSARAITQQAQSVSEPLSERELEVLHLLGTDLSGPEMARHLMVSLNTLHTHTKNIYGKLGVNSRRTAVRRAEELHLL